MKRAEIEITGIMQGIVFRPYIYNSFPLGMILAL